MHDAGDGLLDKDGRVVVDAVVNAFGEAGLELLHLLSDGMSRVERVRTRQLKHGQSRGRFAIQIAVHVVILGAQLHAFLRFHAFLVGEGIANDVFEMNDAALVAGLEDDVLELINGGKSSLGVNGQLELNGRGGRHGRLAEPTGGHLAILLLHRIDDVDGGQVLGSQLVRIEPDAHAVVTRPEKRHVAHSLNTREIVLDAQGCEVAEIKLVVVIAAVRLLARHEVDAQEDTWRLLLGGDADAFHFFGQFSLGDRNAVLHQDLGGVQVRSQLEGDVQVHLAVIGALRGHVEHSLDAVDLLLDGGGHGVGDRFGVGAGIGGRDLNGRRRDLRVLRNGKLGVGHHADNHNNYRQHRGEYGPVDKEVRYHLQTFKFQEPNSKSEKGQSVPEFRFSDFELAAGFCGSTG